MPPSRNDTTPDLEAYAAVFAALSKYTCRLARFDACRSDRGPPEPVAFLRRLG